jgi:hypothetical protein
VADITSCLKVKEGIMKNFLIKDAAIADHFAYEFRTLIYISKRGVYRFYTISDDGSKLYIDDKLIVDNDGGHSVRRAEGKVALEKGYHALHLLYFEKLYGAGTGGRIFRTRYSRNSHSGRDAVFAGLEFFSPYRVVPFIVQSWYGAFV